LVGAGRGVVGRKSGLDDPAGAALLMGLLVTSGVVPRLPVTTGYRPTRPPETLDTTATGVVCHHGQGTGRRKWMVRR